MTTSSNTTVEDVSSVRKRLTIEVPAAEVQRELDRAFDLVRQRAHLRGFRPGKAPRRVLERTYGDQVRHEVLARLVQASFHEAVETHALEVVGSPEIDADAVESGTPLRYTALIDVQPTIEVGDLSGIEVARETPTVADEDVERTLRRLRESAAQLRPIEDRGAVEAGDVVTVDLTSRLADNPPQERSDVMIEAGAGAFDGSLEGQIVGQHVGAARALDVTYPDDYGNRALAGKTVHFDVQLKALHAKDLPPLDDDFARDQGMGDTLEELRGRVRADLEQQAAARAETGMREAALRALADRHPFEVPPSLVDRRCDAMLSSLDVRLPEGVEGEQTLARLREQVRPQAEHDVRIDLLLDAVAASAGVEVTDADVSAEIEALLADEANAERLRTLYQRDEARAALKTRLVRRRALEHVLTQAKIVTAPAPSEVAPG